MDKQTELLMEMEVYAGIHKVPIISRTAAARLIKLVSRKQPESILEIGTAIGYSTMLIARHMPGNARLVTIEQNQTRLEVAEKYLAQAGLLGRVQLIAGDAGVVLTDLTEKFDMVFIDAAKGQYLDYLFKIMNKLSNGALVIADNVLFRGMVYSDNPPRRYRTIVKRLKGYLEYVCGSRLFITTVYDDGDGLAVSYYQGESNCEKT